MGIKSQTAGSKRGKHVPDQLDGQRATSCNASDCKASDLTRLGCHGYGWPEPYIYTVYIRYSWQGNHQIYGHIRCIYTFLASPSHGASQCSVSSMTENGMSYTTLAEMGVLNLAS